MVFYKVVLNKKAIFFSMHLEIRVETKLSYLKLICGLGQCMDYSHCPKPYISFFSIFEDFQVFFTNGSYFTDFHVDKLKSTL